MQQKDGRIYTTDFHILLKEVHMYKLLKYKIDNNYVIEAGARRIIHGSQICRKGYTILVLTMTMFYYYNYYQFLCQQMFDILQPGCHGIIEDPYSISLDKLRTAFDYILSVSDELFKEQAMKEMEEQEQVDDTNESKERDEL